MINLSNEHSKNNETSDPMKSCRENSQIPIGMLSEALNCKSYKTNIFEEIKKDMKGFESAKRIINSSFR